MGYNTGGGQGQFAFCSKANWLQAQSFPVYMTQGGEVATATSHCQVGNSASAEGAEA